MKTKKLIAALVMTSITAHGMPVPACAATPISTEAAALSDRERIVLHLDKAEVVEQLEAHGVAPGEAKARVAALSDAEVRQLAATMDSAPAGGFVEAFFAIGPLIVFGAILIATAALVIVGVTVKVIGAVINRGDK